MLYASIVHIIYSSYNNFVIFVVFNDSWIGVLDIGTLAEFIHNFFFVIFLNNTVTYIYKVLYLNLNYKGL